MIDPKTTPEPILRVRDLCTTFETPHGQVRAVDGVSFDLYPGETLAIVGESGSGKSVTAASLLRMVDPPGRIVAGHVWFKGEDLLAAREKDVRAIRGLDLAMVFQDAMTALNPVRRVGTQIEEIMRAHDRFARQARPRAVEMLARVGVPAPDDRVGDYPHEFSGGMRQRAMIGMGTANDPAILIADEPTTALDVTIQAQVLRLIAELNDQIGTAVILITHDMQVVAQACQRVLVMYAGTVVEEGPVERVLNDPRHPYTAALVRSMPRATPRSDRRLFAIPGQPPDPGEKLVGCPFEPRCATRIERCATERPVLAQVAANQRAACWVAEAGGTPVEITARTAPSRNDRSVTTPVESTGPILEVVNLVKHFAVGSASRFGRTHQVVHALDGVSLSLRPGETLGLVGESGCGKSTLARCLVWAEPSSAGTIKFQGADVTKPRGGQLRQLRRQVQMVFQDPYSSQNPRMRIGAALAEPLQVHHLASGAGISRRVGELLDMVGLSKRYADRYPHEFSGGQRQRIGIARALACEPSLIVADEPVSALDVSIQAQILNLLIDLQTELNLTYLFISHDLGVVRHVSDHLAVMYLGKVVESAPAEEIYERPLHPYTTSLLAVAGVHAVPGGRSQVEAAGEIPSPLHPPSGCRFHTRCPVGPLTHPERLICKEHEPALRELRDGHVAACHFAEESLLPAPTRRTDAAGAALSNSIPARKEPQ